MKILIVGDVHLEHSVRSARNRDKAVSSLVIDVIAKQVNDLDPDVLFVTGDLFDEFGVINSSLASHVKSTFVQMGRRGEGKGRRSIVFVAGNHDYESLNEASYGGSVITALFGHMEELNIYTADRTAKAIDVGGGVTLLGLPYRETLEEFERDCLPEILKLKESGKKAVVGWHVGLPFGEECWKGDENENGWIVESHPHVQSIFDVALAKTVFCSHYHGPASVPTSIGKFLYIGSPATRSRTESGQNKRTVLFDTDTLVWKPVSTHLSLDVMVGSIDEALAHIEDMKGRFGPEVEDILNVHIKLQDGSSLDEYATIKSIATSKSGAIKVEKPITSRKSKIEEMIQQIGDKDSLSKQALELEMARLAVVEYFRGREFDVPFDSLLSSLRGDLKALLETLDNALFLETGVEDYLNEHLPQVEGGAELLMILKNTVKRGGSITDKLPTAIRLIETKRTMDFLTDMVK